MGQHKSKFVTMKDKAKKCRTVHSLKELLNIEEVDVNGLYNTDEYQGVTPMWLAVR